MKDKEWERAIEKHLVAVGWMMFDKDVWRALQVKVKRGPMWLNLRADLWGCIDIAAMHAERGFLFVQATTTKGVNERRRKIEAHGWPLLPAAIVSALEKRWPARLPDEPLVQNSFFRNLLEAFYRVQIWEARTQRSMADSRKWEYAARIHQYHSMTKDWTVAADIVPIAK